MLSPQVEAAQWKVLHVRPEAATSIRVVNDLNSLPKSTAGAQIEESFKQLLDWYLRNMTRFCCFYCNGDNQQVDAALQPVVKPAMNRNRRSCSRLSTCSRQINASRPLNSPYGLRSQKHLRTFCSRKRTKSGSGK